MAAENGLEAADRTQVLVVEDEESFAEALSIGLQREGFAVEVASDGLEAINAFEAHKGTINIILLDIMLPKLSGLDVCRKIRSTSDVPIIMVSAKGEELDAVVGLEMGADDYVVKPYRLRELVARMRSVLRRFESAPSTQAEAAESVMAVVVGDVTIDPDSHEVFVGDDQITMPLKEFELLQLLAENAGRVLTRDVLIERIWGYDYVGDTKTLDVHIKRIRAKIEPDPSNPVKIVTIRGLGYKYEKALQSPRTAEVS